MRGISWLAAKPVSFSRRTLLHGVSKSVKWISTGNIVAILQLYSQIINLQHWMTDIVMNCTYLLQRRSKWPIRIRNSAGQSEKTYATHMQLDQLSKLVPSDGSLRRIPANGAFGKYLSFLDLCYVVGKEDLQHRCNCLVSELTVLKRQWSLLLCNIYWIGPHALKIQSKCFYPWQYKTVQNVFKQEKRRNKPDFKTHDVFRIRYLKFTTILKRNKSKSALVAKEWVYKYINVLNPKTSFMYQQL